MKCLGCGGEINLIDIKKRALLRTGCVSYDYGYACDKCGLLHFVHGKKPAIVQSRDEKKAYLVEGKVGYEEKKEKKSK